MHHRAKRLTIPATYKITTPNNKAIVNKVKADFESGVDFHYLFLGKAGRGKTLLAEIINKHLNHYTVALRRSDCYSLYNEFRSCGYNFDMKKRFGHGLFLDDIGREGDAQPPVDMMKFILNYRYDVIRYNPRFDDCQYKNLPALTILTSNLDIPTFKLRYGDYIWSRITEFFDIFVFDGEDLRVKNGRVIIAPKNKEN